MWHQLQQWFTPPIFSDDQEKSFRARLLFAISTLFIIMIFGNIIFTFATSAHLFADLILNIFVLIIMGACLYWTRHGHIQLAGMVLSGSLWLATTLLVIQYGAQDVITNGYILVIITTILLTNGWGGLMVVVFSATALTLITLAETNGWHTPSLPTTAFSILRLNIQIYVAVGVLLYGASRVIIKALAQARQAEAALRKQQNHLEKIVTERTAVLLQTNNSLHQEIQERRRVENELRLHEAIVENMAEGVHLIRISDGTIIYANPKVEKMFGYEPSEMIGIHVSQLNAPTEETSPEKTAADIITDLRQKGYWRGEVYNIKKNGEPFWCATHVSTFEHAIFGTIWISVREDITQRKQTEEELSQYRQHLQEMVNKQTAALKTTNEQLQIAEERYRIIAELTSDFAYSIQIAADGRLHLEWLSSAFTRILGYDTGTFLSISDYLATIYTEDVPLVTQRIATLIASESAITEYRSVAKDGRIHWMRDYSRPVWSETEQRVVRIYGAAQDISEQKEAQAKLLQERALLRAVIDNLPDYIYLKDTEQRIILSNEANAHSLGADSAQAVVGKLLSDFYPQAEVDRYNALDKIILTSGQAIINQENAYTDIITGQKRWALLTRLPFYDDGGMVIGTLGVSRDITQRREVQELLQNRLKFETAVADISSNFVRFPTEEVDQAIQIALQKLAELTGAVRSSVFRFDDDIQTVWNTHEWCSDPQYSQMAQFQDFPAEFFGWYLETLKRFEILSTNRLSDLPLKTAREREWVAQHGFQAQLFVPMISGDTLIGALGFYGSVGQEIEWPEEYVSLLTLVADLIVNALARQQAERQIKASLQEKEVLLKEIHHRVKNNLQVIASLLDLQSDYIADESVKNLLRESQSRVRSMALVHEQLYQKIDLARIDFADYVQRLMDYLLSSYRQGDDSVGLVLEVAPLLLTIETAVPLGLIINELVSNAFKHAFHNAHSGQISIRLEETDSNEITLIVSDNGPGLPPDLNPDQINSLGLTIVTALTQQLYGRLQWSNQPGATWQLTLPHQPITLN